MKTKKALAMLTTLLVLSINVMLADSKVPAVNTTPKIAFIIATGDLTSPYNSDIYNGIQSVYDDKKASNITYTVAKSANDYAPLVDQYVKEGYNIIVMDAIFMQDIAIASAKKYHNVKFIIVDVDIAESEHPDNLYSIKFQEDQAGFLAGVLAGLLTDNFSKSLPGLNADKKVGIIRGMEIPVIAAFTDGYSNGVRYVCGDCKVVSDTINSFDDNRKSYDAAKKMYQDGVDIIFSVAGAAIGGVTKAADESKKYTVGVDNDMHSLSPSIIASSMKKLGYSTRTTLLDVIDNKSKTHHRTYDIKNGGIALSPFYDYDKSIPSEVKDTLRTVIENIRNDLLFTE